MALIPGYGGSVTFPGLTAGVKSFTLNQSADTHDVTCFDNVGTSREYVLGLDDWTIEASVFYDSDNTVDLRDTGAFVGTIAAGDTVSGTVFVSNMSIPVDKQNGSIEQTLSLRGSGTLTKV